MSNPFVQVATESAIGGAKQAFGFAARQFGSEADHAATVGAGEIADRLRIKQAAFLVLAEDPMDANGKLAGLADSLKNNGTGDM